jgi:hypothetical protein
MGSVQNGTRVIAGLSIVLYLVACVLGFYLGRLSMPILEALISGGGGYEAFLFGIIVASYFALAGCGAIFTVLTIWVLRSPVKKRKWLLILGIAGLGIPALLSFYYFGLMLAAAPVLGGAALTLIAYAYSGKGRH